MDFHYGIHKRSITEFLTTLFLITQYTDGCKTLHTILVKHYNDLLDRQSSEWDRKVAYFYVRDVFGIYLGSMYADFQEKFSRRFQEESFKLFIDVTLLVSVFQASHYSALLIGCVMFCTHL